MSTLETLKEIQAAFQSGKLILDPEKYGRDFGQMIQDLSRITTGVSVAIYQLESKAERGGE